MLEFYTQLSSDGTLDGQANDHSKKKILKRKSRDLSSTSVHCVFFGSNLIFLPG